MRLINIFILLIIFFSHQSFSQDNAIYRIKGVVKDEYDGHSMVDVMIFLKNHDHIGTFTNAKGEFTITIPAHVQDDFLSFSAAHVLKTRSRI